MRGENISKIQDHNNLNNEDSIRTKMDIIDWKIKKLSKIEDAIKKLEDEIRGYNDRFGMDLKGASPEIKEGFESRRAILTSLRREFNMFPKKTILEQEYSKLQEQLRELRPKKIQEQKKPGISSDLKEGILDREYSKLLKKDREQNAQGTFSELIGTGKPNLELQKRHGDVKVDIQQEQLRELESKKVGEQLKRDIPRIAAEVQNEIIGTGKPNPELQKRRGDIKIDMQHIDEYPKSYISVESWGIKTRIFINIASNGTLYFTVKEGDIGEHGSSQANEFSRYFDNKNPSHAIKSAILSANKANFFLNEALISKRGDDFNFATITSGDGRKTHLYYGNYIKEDFFPKEVKMYSGGANDDYLNYRLKELRSNTTNEKK